MLGLLVAGSVVVVVGILSVVFAYPMKDFSFGSTLIVSGVVTACTGAVLIAAALLLRELRVISRALAGAGPSLAPRSLEAVAPLPVQRTAPLSSPVSEAPPPAPVEASPPPWRGETATAPALPDAAEGETPGRRRRNLLFMSSKRDRPVTFPGDAAEGAAAPGESPAEPAPSFDDAWPASERARPEPARQAAPPQRPEAPPARPSPPPIRRPAEAQQVTILKSGVVDGMAYSLYSDGSIEAQLPEGMIRFASIDELRHHLDQRGG